MLYDSLQALIAFVLTITVVVFIHELGHYTVAKLSGIKVTDFSIGFGPKICSIKDSSGTEWKISMIPLGGYVKFLGDTDPTSSDNLKLDTKERKHAFFNKSLLTKALVVVAGPVANFLLGIFIFTYFFFMHGTLVSNTEIQTVLPGSPAAQIELRPGDKIVAVDDHKTTDFNELASYIAINPGIKINLTIERNKEIVKKDVVPQALEIKDKVGNSMLVGKLGVTFSAPQHKKLSFLSSINASCKEIGRMTALTLKGIGQMIHGQRGTKELGGPIKIARYAGASMQEGAFSILYFISLISVNLGIVNLLPIPLLDGGHLFFYAAEAICGKKISGYIQKYAIKVGFIALLSLMLLAVLNDIIYF